MNKTTILVWENRTKVLSYLGMLLAQLGTSGIITNAKAVAWVAFAASASTAAVGHLNDWLKRRQELEAQPPENPQ